MNCHDFRSRWMNTVNEATLSHIETCDDCLNWIDTAFSTDEEVAFMKEFPQPSAELEDRIMQAIYATAGPGQGALPPLSATKQTLAVKLKKRKPHRPRFRTGAWVGAAGLFLVVGLIGMQTILNGSSKDQAAAPAGDSTSSYAHQAKPRSGEGTTYSLPEEHMPAVGQTVPDQSAAFHAAAEAEPTESAAVEESQQAASASIKEPAPEQPEKELSDLALTAMDTQPSPEASLPLRPHTELSSRDAGNKTVENPNTPTSYAGLHENTGQSTDAESEKKGEPVPSVGNVQNEAAAKPDVSVMDADAEDGKTMQTGQPSNGVMAEQRPLTVSTFTDVKAAAQVSDIPVPVLANLPDGFALKTISLKYQTETSNQVKAVSVSYVRDHDQVTVSIARNDKPKRHLSIPGTFVERRLFAVGKDQAIAVTHDPNTSSGKVEHEVHMATSHDGLPFYVILTGDGVRLDDLIEAARTIQWDQE
ncbi:MAG: hypothetical protein H0Z34_14840 [Brevibacillus sp.]|nr:hypothetical protein [Brevibacillus sp.]